MRGERLAKFLIVNTWIYLSLLKKKLTQWMLIYNDIYLFMTHFPTSFHANPILFHMSCKNKAWSLFFYKGRLVFSCNHKQFHLRIDNYVLYHKRLDHFHSLSVIVKLKCKIWLSWWSNNYSIWLLIQFVVPSKSYCLEV